MTKAEFQITRELVTKIHGLLDRGLCSGVGEPKPGKMCVEAAICYAMDLPHSDQPTCVTPALRLLKITLNDASWSSNKARAEGLRRVAIAQLGSAGALDEKEFARRCSELAIRTCVPAALRAAASIHPNEEHKDALLKAAERCEIEGSYAARAASDAASDAASYAASDAASAASDAACAASYAARAAASYAACAASYAAGDAASYAARDAARAASDAARAASYAASYAAGDKQLSDFAEGVVQILIEMKAPGCEWLDLNEAA